MSVPLTVPINLPNLLSLVRMGLIPFFIIALGRGEMGKALAIFVVAGITDGLDGFIARVTGTQTTLGAYLDPAADKLLQVSAFVVLTFESVAQALAIPFWVTVLVIARDVLIIVLVVGLYMAHNVTNFPPTMISKTNTVAQITSVILVLLFNMRPDWTGVGEAAQWNLYLVAVLTVASGVHYVWRANRVGHLASIGEWPEGGRS